MARETQPHGPITDAIRTHERSSVPADRLEASLHLQRHPLYMARIVADVVRSASWDNRARIRIQLAKDALEDATAVVEQANAQGSSTRDAELRTLKQACVQVGSLLERGVAGPPRRYDAPPRRRGRPKESVAMVVRDNVIAQLVNAVPEDEQPSPAEIAFYLHEITGERLTIREVSREIHKISTADEKRQPPERLIQHPRPTRPQTAHGKYL